MPRFDQGYSLSIRPNRVVTNVAAGVTDFEIVPAQDRFRIVVIQLVMLAGGDDATDITFNSAGVPVTPVFTNAANGGGMFPFSPVGWFESARGESLTVTTTDGSTTAILLSWVPTSRNQGW